MFPPVQSRNAWFISGRYRNLDLFGLFSFTAAIASLNSWKSMPVVFHAWPTFAWNWRQICITSWSPFQPSHLQPMLTLLTVPSKNPLVSACSKHKAQFCSCPLISSCFATSGLCLNVNKYSENIFLNIIKIHLKFIFLLFASKDETALE